MTLDDGTPLLARRIPVGEVTLHVVEAGPADGRPVILLHGFPEFWWGWRHQIGPMARAGYRVIVPDGRGYGLSDRPAGIEAYRLPRLVADIAGLADALGIERFHLVGHDWGGIVAFALAARHPERVRRLAILNAPHPDVGWRTVRADPRQLARSWYVAFFHLPGLPERMLSRHGFSWLKRALAGSGRRQTFSLADLERYSTEWSRPGALTAMLGWYRAISRRWPRVGRITMPTIILWGRRDSALGPAVATESLAMCDDGRIRWFDRATHWVQHEEAEAVSGELLVHLGGDEMFAVSARS